RKRLPTVSVGCERPRYRFCRSSALKGLPRTLSAELGFEIGPSRMLAAAPKSAAQPSGDLRAGYSPKSRERSEESRRPAPAVRLRCSGRFWRMLARSCLPLPRYRLLRVEI